MSGQPAGALAALQPKDAGRIVTDWKENRAALLVHSAVSLGAHRQA
jgi:hypothetical protein